MIDNVAQFCYQSIHEKEARPKILRGPHTDSVLDEAKTQKIRKAKFSLALD